MPPPSQAGKFKPRKPARKIRAGATAATAAAAPEPVHSSQHHGRPSGGGGGRGPGGGRIRAPLPQGEVFFTATPAAAGGKGSRSGSRGTAAGGGGGERGISAGASGMTAANSSAKANTAAGKPSIQQKQGKNEQDANEEVVGTLDKGIGSRFAEAGNSKRDQADLVPSASSRNTRTAALGDDYEDVGRSTSTSKKTSSVLDGGFTYDSDSSEDDDDDDRRAPRGQQKRMTPAPIRNSQTATTRHLLPPNRLPFPVALYPVGVGSQTRERPYTYFAQHSGDDEEVAKTAHDVDRPPTANCLPTSYSTHRPRPSPFVNPYNHEDMTAERDSWFLVQLPTRLPSLTQKIKPVAVSSGNVNHRQDIGDHNGEYDQAHIGKDDSGDAIMLDDGAMSEPQKTALADVARNPIQTDCFDNCLVTAAPGKIGKLLVYQSGKTVLLLQGPNGEPEIRMDVTEGLTCSFQQQAVVIDPEQGTYVKLGDVGKTVVVTPDIDKAFASGS